MSECIHKRYIEDMHGYCPDCGEIRPSLSDNSRIALLKAENQRLRDALRELLETNFCDHDEVVALLGVGNE